MNTLHGQGYTIISKETLHRIEEDIAVRKSFPVEDVRYLVDKVKRAQEEINYLEQSLAGYEAAK